MDCPNCYNTFKELTTECPVCTRPLEPAEQERLERVLARAQVQQRAVRRRWLIYIGITLGIVGLITFGLVWRTRARLSDEEQVRFKKEMREAIARIEAWDKPRKPGMVQAFRDIDTIRTDEPCPIQLPAKLRQHVQDAQLIREAELDKHWGRQMSLARKYLGHGEPGEDNYSGYFNGDFRSLMRGRNLRPKALEWAELMREIKEYSSPERWDYELLFVAIDEVEAVAELEKENFKPGLAAGWALLWDFQQARVACVAPFVATHSATISYLQTYEVDRLGEKRKVDRGEKDLALKRDILDHAYRYAAPRMRKAATSGAGG